MEIEYSLTEIDVLALGEYRFSHSRGLQERLRFRRFAYLIGSGLLAIAAWSLLPYKGLPWLFFTLGAVAFIIMPSLYRWRIRRMILRLYSDPDNRTTLDARTLIANPEGLEEHSGRGEMKMAWDEVDEIAGTPDHTFISFQERPSIVIPRARISKGDYAGFVQGSQDYVRAAEQAGTEDGNGRAS